MIKIVNLLKSSRFWLISCIAVSLIAQSCSVDLGNEENFVKKEAIDRAEKLESLVENENTPVIFGDLDEEFGPDLLFDDEILTYTIAMSDIDHISPQAKKKIKISFTNDVTNKDDFEFQMYALDESSDILLDSAVPADTFWSGARTAFVQANTDLQQNTQYVIKVVEDAVIKSNEERQFTEGPISNIRFRTDFRFEPSIKLSIQYTPDVTHVLNNDAFHQSEQGVIIDKSGLSPNIELSLDFRTGSLAKIESIKVRNVKVDGTSEENKIVNLCGDVANCADVTAVENDDLTSVLVSLTGNLTTQEGHNIYVAEITDHKGNVYHRTIKFQYGNMRDPEDTLGSLPGSMRILLTSDGGLSALSSMIENFFTRSSLGKDQSVSEFMDESFRVNHLTWQQYMMGVHYNGARNNDGTMKSSIEDVYVRSTAPGGQFSEGGNGRDPRCDELTRGYTWSKLYGPYCGLDFQGGLQLPVWMGALTATGMAAASACVAFLPACAAMGLAGPAIATLTFSAEMVELAKSVNGKTRFHARIGLYLNNITMDGFAPSSIDSTKMLQNSALDLKASEYSKTDLIEICDNPRTDQEFVFRKYLDCTKIKNMAGTHFLGVDFGFRYMYGTFLASATDLYMPVGTKVRFGTVDTKIPFSLPMDDANTGRDSNGNIRNPIGMGILFKIENGNLALYSPRSKASMSLRSVRTDVSNQTNFDTVHKSDSDFRSRDIPNSTDHDKVTRFIMTYSKLERALGYDILKMDHLLDYLRIDPSEISVIERKGLVGLINKTPIRFVVDAILDVFTKRLSDSSQFRSLALGSVTYSLVINVMSKFLDAIFLPFKTGQAGISFSSYLPAPFNKASAAIKVSFKNMGIFSKTGGSSGLEASLNGSLLARNGHLFTDNGNRKEDLTGLVPNLPKYVSASGGVEDKSTFLTISPDGLPFDRGSKSLVNAGFTTNAVALSPDLVNQMLYSLWREGVFNLDYDSNFSSILSVFSNTPAMRDFADGLLITGQLLPILDPFRSWGDFTAPPASSSIFGPQTETISSNDTMMFRIKFLTPPTLTSTLSQLRRDVPVMNLDFGDGIIQVRGRREDGSTYQIANIRLGMKAKTEFSISYFSNPKNISAMDKFVAFKLGLLRGKENFQYVVSIDDGQQANPMKLDPKRVKRIISAIIPDVVVPILDSVMSELPLQRLSACGMQFQNMAVRPIPASATEQYLTLTFDSDRSSYDSSVKGLNCGVGDSRSLQEDEVGSIPVPAVPVKLTPPAPAQEVTLPSNTIGLGGNKHSYAKACHLNQESIIAPVGESNVDLRSLDVIGDNGEVITTIDSCHDSSHVIHGKTVESSSIKTKYEDSRRAHCTENNGDFSISSDYEYFCTTQNVVQSACSGTFTQTSAPGVVPSTSTCQVDISTTDMPARLVL